jgi:hypothetical protein
MPFLLGGLPDTVDNLVLVRCLVRSPLLLLSCAAGLLVQVCWLWQKVQADGPAGTSFQRFLDNQQYTNKGILRYERVFGKGFVSTGGLGRTCHLVHCWPSEGRAAGARPSSCLLFAEPFLCFQSSPSLSVELELEEEIDSIAGLTRV